MNRDSIRRIGALLRPVRAGMSRLAVNRRDLAGVPASIRVASSAFAPGGAIPRRYTADGEGTSPPLTWEGVPDGAVSLMLLVEDPDLPAPVPLVHALVCGIPPDRDSLREGAIPYRVPSGRVVGRTGMIVGRAGFGRAGWVAPSPPPGHGPHHYAFQVFALAASPVFEWAPGRAYALSRVIPHVLAHGTLFGIYERL